MGSVLATPLSDPIGVAPIQTILMSPPTEKRKKKKKTHNGFSPSRQVTKEMQKVCPSVTIEFGGLAIVKKIGEVQDFDLYFRTYPISGSVNALTRRIGRVSSNRALGHPNSPPGTTVETLQLTVDHAAEVFF